jgi:hypothetical protein
VFLFSDVRSGEIGREEERGTCSKDQYKSFTKGLCDQISVRGLVVLEFSDERQLQLPFLN